MGARFRSGVTTSGQLVWTNQPDLELVDLNAVRPSVPVPPVIPPAPPPAPLPVPTEPTMPQTPNLSTFDFSQVVSTRDGGDVQRFARTASVTSAGWSRDTLTIAYDKAGQWPAHDVGPDGAAVDGNQWFLVYKNGRWVAGVNEWTRPGQIAKVVTAEDLYGAGNGVFYDPNRFGELYQWHPVVGETVGVFMTTPARAGVQTTPLERSNVAFLLVQADRTMAQVGAEGGTVEPVPVPVPTPTPTPQPSPCQWDPELVSRMAASQQALLEAVQAVTTEQQALKALIQAFVSQPVPAPQVTFPPYQVRVLGQTVTAHPMKP